MNRTTELDGGVGEATQTTIYNITAEDSEESSDFFRTPGLQPTVISIYAIILLLIVILNTVAILQIRKAKTALSIPFSMYVVHLLAINILASILDIPLDVYALTTDNQLTFTLCSAYQGTNWVFFGVVINSHFLITVNRLWAVTYPHIYRKLHSTRFAALSILAVWINVAFWTLPVLIYRIVSDKGDDKCDLDIMEALPKNLSISAWEITTFSVVYFAPVVAVIVLYPVIECKRRMRLSQRRHLQVHPDNSLESTAATTKLTEQRNTESRSFRALMALTGSILLSLMPYLIWAVIQNYVEASVNRWSFELTDLVLDYVWTAQALLDPVLFVLVFRARI